MTVLIAQNTKDKIILGADSGLFYGNSGFKVHLNNHKGFLKIMSINDITFSACGSGSELINFGLFCQTRKPERSDQLGIQRFFIDFGIMESTYFWKLTSGYCIKYSKAT